MSMSAARTTIQIPGLERFSYTANQVGGFDLYDGDELIAEDVDYRAMIRTAKNR